MNKIGSFEVGKIYTLKNGEVITVTDIERRAFDGAILVGYRTADGKIGDSTPNSLFWSLAG